MPNHSAVGVANEFLRRRGSSSWPQQMLIQKLSYIAHGWNLAINGEALIEELPEAWDNGPVYRGIWNAIKEFGYSPDGCLLKGPEGQIVVEKFNDSESAIIEHVWKKYSNYSASQLSRMTHEPDTPWSLAYFGRGRNTDLVNSEIKKHYVDLALAGRGN